MVRCDSGAAGSRPGEGGALPTGAALSAVRVEELLIKHLGCDESQARACASGLLGTPAAVPGPAPSARTVYGAGRLSGAVEDRRVRATGAKARAGTVRHGSGPHVGAVGPAAARNPVELAQHLLDRTEDTGATSVLLAVADGDGGLRTSGVAGTAARTGSDWSQIPLHCLLPLARMSAADQQVWLDDEAGGRSLTWVSAGGVGTGGPCAAGAHRGPGATVCVVSVLWSGPARPAPTARARLETLADRTGQRLRELAALEPRDDGVRAAWLDAVVDAIPVPAALLRPLRDPVGRVVEFTVDRCNARVTDLLGRTPDQITGSRLLETFPGMLLSGLFDAYVAVLETGVPLDRGPFSYEEPFQGVTRPAVLSVRAQRVADGLLVTWKFHDEQAHTSTRIDDDERLVNLGWAEWNLATGGVTWSRRMYDILERDLGSGPLPLDALSGYVIEEDLPTVVEAVQSLARGPGPVRFEVRTRASEGPRHVSVSAELLRDSLGNLVALRGVVQDVTGVRRTEAALEATRREAESRQLRMAEELQLALLPRAHTTLPGLRTAIRYQPAENCARVGGDWFEATPLPDGRVLIAIGDVLGHGLQAAAGMAQLRNALLGIAYTGADAARILDCLNLVAFHGHDESLNATAAVGHFDPQRRTLTWARAGHPPPVLVRGGRATELVNDDGTSLGASLDPGYACKTLSLRPGDRVILYTDGLVERRSDRSGNREDLLLSAARQGAHGGPEAHLETLLSVLHTNPEDDTCVIVLHVGS
ncbi:SpoIIE family protein phosphatase [Streptomyces rimosus]|uniref:SpoIIE family protein phosphatase n=1 Tax=Streptomyces rimosus TaxID=1927 RepID=UPI00067CA5ED|nr:SpoIIE family protein phosphatase [Streptomyces rimosus]